MVRVVSALVLPAFLVVGCGSDDPTAAPATSAPVTPTTSAPATSLEATTSSAPSTDPAPTTTAATQATDTAAPILSGWAEPCEESAPSRPLSELDEAALDVFGPIGPEPAIEIALPAGYSVEDGTLHTGSAVGVRIPGGVLLTIGGPSYHFFGGGMNVAIDADGRVRWRRCASVRAYQIVVAAPSLRPDRALIADGTGVQQFRVISLADGSSVGALAEITGDLPANGAPLVELVPGGSRYALLKPASDHVTDAAVDRLGLLDLVTMEVDPFEMPPGASGRQTWELQLRIDEDDRVVSSLVRPDGRVAGATAVYVAGGWTTDAGTIAEVSPPSASFAWNANDAAPLQLLDGDGGVRWQRDDVVMRPGEGRFTEIVGDVVLAFHCTSTTCDDFRLGAFGLEDGAMLWESAGAQAFLAADDGVALVTRVAGSSGGPGGWQMIDVRTGEQVSPDQSWDADRPLFFQECCGGEESARVDRFGGVLIAHNGDVVRVWLPRGSAQTTATVDLDDP